MRSDAAVSINLAKNMASGGDATGDRLFNIEGVYGTQYDDVIVGDDNANSLFGARGVDEIRGGGGDDVIVGGTNPLAGKVEGDEPLLPFEVGDQLWGDGGDDSFRFDLGDSGGLKDNGILLSGPDQRGIDTIHDFDLNGDDTLVFELNPRYRAVWDAEHVAIAGTPIIGTFLTVREFHRVYSEPGDSYEVFLQNTPKHMIDGDDFEFWSIPY